MPGAPVGVINFHFNEDDASYASKLERLRRDPDINVATLNNIQLQSSTVQHLHEALATQHIRHLRFLDVTADDNVISDIAAALRCSNLKSLILIRVFSPAILEALRLWFGSGECKLEKIAFRMCGPPPSLTSVFENLLHTRIEKVEIRSAIDIEVDKLCSALNTWKAKPDGWSLKQFVLTGSFLTYENFEEITKCFAETTIQSIDLSVNQTPQSILGPVKQLIRLCPKLEVLNLEICHVKISSLDEIKADILVHASLRSLHLRTEHTDFTPETKQQIERFLEYIRSRSAKCLLLFCGTATKHSIPLEMLRELKEWLG